MTEALTSQQVLRRKKFGEPIESDDAPSSRRHIITVLLEDSIGALNRVLNLFSARGFNLESVAVGQTDEPSIARMTLATSGSDRIVAQVIRQLEGLVDTLEVVDLTEQDYVERELCLLKVQYTARSRAEIMDSLSIFRGKVVDVTPATMTFEVTGPTKKVNAFIGLMKPHGIVEMARSGRVAMRRAMFYGD